MRPVRRSPDDPRVDVDRGSEQAVVPEQLPAIRRQFPAESGLDPVHPRFDPDDENPHLARAEHDSVAGRASMRRKRLQDDFYPPNFVE